MTTTDICTELGVSRSTFKGWVYDILDRTQEQNDKTELEFTEDEIAKLWLIRFYKQLKYSNSQIKEILNNPDFDITKTLLHQIEELNSQKNEIDNLIKVASIMKKSKRQIENLIYRAKKSLKQWLEKEGFVYEAL